MTIALILFDNMLPLLMYINFELYMHASHLEIPCVKLIIFPSKLSFGKYMKESAEIMLDLDP